MTYGNKADIAFHLNKYKDKASGLMDAIDNIAWKDEATNTSGALRTMREDMFTQANGDRRNAPNIAIVITGE